MFVTGTFFILIFTSLILIPYLAEHLGKEQKIINMLYVFSALVLLLNFLAFEIYPLKGADAYIPGRFRGYLENPNTLGLMSFISFPLLLYKYKTALTRRKKLINILLLLAAITLAVIASSRASLLGIIMILAVYFYYYNRRIFVLGVIFSTVIIIIILSSPVLLELLRIAGDPLSQRDKIWQLGINAWKEDIIFGGGFGTTHLITGNKYAFMVKGIFEFLLGAHFHNIYIEILYETGIIGLIIFLSIILLMLSETNKVINNSHGDKKIFTICYYALLIAIIVQSAFESFILSAGNVPSLIFWILTGLVLNGRQNIRQQFNK
jgi:O-antigen ligase